MSKVTALEPRRGTLRLFLDGKPALTVRREVAAQHGLCVGQELSDSDMDALARADRLYNCLMSAERFLAYRPHSESELRSKLARRYGRDTVDPIIARLKDQGLVDDASFCEYWSHSRQTSNPRSQRLVRLELRQKGVGTDLTQLVNSDDYESAYRAAQSRIRHLTGDDKSRQRLADFLRRRGFSYEVVTRTIALITKERAGPALEKTTGRLIRG